MEAYAHLNYQCAVRLLATVSGSSTISDSGYRFLEDELYRWAEDFRHLAFGARVEACRRVVTHLRRQNGVLSILSHLRSFSHPR